VGSIVFRLVKPGCWACGRISRMLPSSYPRRGALVAKIAESLAARQNRCKGRLTPA
jgi:hypothetical protein